MKAGTGHPPKCHKIGKVDLLIKPVSLEPAVSRKGTDSERESLKERTWKNSSQKRREILEEIRIIERVATTITITEEGRDEGYLATGTARHQPLHTRCAPSVKSIIPEPA